MIVMEKKEILWQMFQNVGVFLCQKFLCKHSQQRKHPVFVNIHIFVRGIFQNAQYFVACLLDSNKK